MGSHRRPWVHVYPISGRTVNINNTGERVEFGPQLEQYAREQWQPKAEKGWKSAWIALARRAHVTPNSVTIDAGAMPFFYVDALNKAIEGQAPFPTQATYTPCLSVGFVTATADDKVVFQRRAPDVHCPNVLIHEPCGYMASLYFAPRPECDKPEHTNDPRLFDLPFQLAVRQQELARTFNLPPHAVTYKPGQDLLAAGWMSTEMYFSTTGRIAVPQHELALPEGKDFRFVPFEDLRTLIHNQGRLSKVDPSTYEPQDHTDIPLIDESLVGLIWGHQHLTGEPLNIEETVERLSREGLEIRVIKPSKEDETVTYEFPNRF